MEELVSSWFCVVVSTEIAFFDITSYSHIAEDGTKTSVASVTGYGDNMVQSKLDNILYKQIIALYISGDSHVDEKVDVLDLVAMKKAEKG